MGRLVFLVAVVVALYVAWFTLRPRLSPEHKAAIKFHAPRILLLVLVVLAIAWAVYYLPTIPFVF